jgi:hypothetical protein
MKNLKITAYWLVLPVLICITSCVSGILTEIAITNQSGKTAKIESADSDKHVEVKPGFVTIIPHVSGTVNVTFSDGRTYHYPEISVLENKKYASWHGHKFKPSELRLNLVLTSNGVIHLVQETNKLQIIIKEFAPKNSGSE